MIRLLMTEDEAATLTSFLMEHGADQDCAQSHPVCFVLARLLAAPHDVGHLIPKDKHPAQAHRDTA